MLPLLEKSLHGSYAIALEIGPEPCPALIDIADLELALLNLLTNARDAMPAGGPIRISVAAERGPMRSRRGSSLACTTAASGMPPEVQKRAFEPFFTTKSIGKGTGLGLSSVYGFARQSGGTAQIRAGPGGHQRAARAAGQHAAAALGVLAAQRESPCHAAGPHSQGVSRAPRFSWSRTTSSCGW